MRVYLFQKDILPLIATVHNVTHRAGILHLKPARRGDVISTIENKVRPIKRLVLRYDPINIAGRQKEIVNPVGGHSGNLVLGVEL